MTARWFVFAHEVGAAAKLGRAHERPLHALHLANAEEPTHVEPICGASARVVGPLDQPAGFALACVECLRRSEGSC